MYRRSSPLNEGIKDDILDRTLVFLYEDSFPVHATIVLFALWRNCVSVVAYSCFRCGILLFVLWRTCVLCCDVLVFVLWRTCVFVLWRTCCGVPLEGMPHQVGWYAITGSMSHQDKGVCVHVYVGACVHGHTWSKTVAYYQSGIFSCKSIDIKKNTFFVLTVFIGY